MIKEIKFIKDANKITGGLTKTTKMPCDSFNLSALDCKVGSRLRDIEGSVCEDCYALSGNYKRFHKTIFKAMTKRKKALKSKLWVQAMVKLINAQAQRNGNYFRWHDSGDIQSIEHLKKIINVCELTPTILHWLPTRELKIIKAIKKSSVPGNLIIRVSGAMVNGKPPKNYSNTSTVITNNLYARKSDFICPSNIQGNQCKNCRACWDSKIKNITYIKH